MGDIPDCGLFRIRHPVLEKALTAYFDSVKAVRTGSLSQFQTILAKHAVQFEADWTFTLIDAEYIVGKAIRDGVVVGKIVHECDWMECGGLESREVFLRCIGYCLELHTMWVQMKLVARQLARIIPKLAPDAISSSPWVRAQPHAAGSHAHVALNLMHLGIGRAWAHIEFCAAH
ncbi:hypothetical protein B0H13DRAFT_1859679 [Mycena leptocephala]|nr:hypothetical protein B0H13DRAFT_1859679 [Mycena leptocephala]